MAHARAYLRGLRDGAFSTGGLRLLDLGSGGGVPGLVLAIDLPSSRWVLVDAGSRRTAFLSAAVGQLKLEARVEVVTGRAEELGRDPLHRRAYQVVVARSFGRPAVVAECAAPFLELGGSLLVSEPPGERDDRWASHELAQLGLRMVGRSSDPPHLVVLRQESLCPERFPRRVGVPAKRPLW